MGSAQSLYLVEQFSGGLSLRQFVERSHGHIRAGRLCQAFYQKLVKHICWQLVVAIRWMHDVHRCCHLALNLDHVLVENIKFVKRGHGVAIEGTACIKIIDFGVSEVFSSKRSFRCDKECLTLDDEHFIAPNVLNGERFDASKADMYSLGMILFTALCGEEYRSEAVGKLEYHLKKRNLLRFFKRHSIQILKRLLVGDEKQRWSAEDVVRSEWFRSYAKRYGPQLQRKHAADKAKLRRMEQNGDLVHLPLYSLH